MKYKIYINAHALLLASMIGLVFPTSLYTDVTYFITSVYFIVSCIGMVITITTVHSILSTMTPSVLEKIKSSDDHQDKIHINNIKRDTEITYSVLHNMYTNYSTHITFAMISTILIVAYLSQQNMRFLYLELITFLILSIILRIGYMPKLHTLINKIEHERRDN